MATLARGGNYKEGADARLVDILSQAADGLNYDVRLVSGYRPGDPRQHGQKDAVDIQLVDRNTGRPLDNYQSAADFRAYEKFAQIARSVQQQKYPDLNQAFRWGGYFSGPPGRYGALDTMHFDLAGKQIGMAGGSWEKGLTAAQRALFPGIVSQGLLQAPVPPVNIGAPNAVASLASAWPDAAPVPSSTAQRDAAREAFAALDAIGIRQTAQSHKNIEDMFVVDPAAQQQTATAAYVPETAVRSAPQIDAFRRPEVATPPVPQQRPVSGIASLFGPAPVPQARPAALLGYASQPSTPRKENSALSAIAESFAPRGSISIGTDGYAFASDGNGKYKQIGTTRPAGMTPAQQYAAVNAAARSRQPASVMDRWRQAGDNGAQDSMGVQPSGTIW